MIYCLQGTVLKKTLDMVVLSCAGVGYQMLVPASVASALPAVGQEATLFTEMHLTENDVTLYGFASEEQKACFKLLTSVSGVGPKVGIAILNVLTPEKITLAISAADHKAFTAANGVGPKLAQRIVLELKDKVAKGLAEGVTLGDVGGSSAAPAGNMTQAIAALTSLGYSPSEAAAAVAKTDETLPVEEIIKLALRSMAKGR
ncbi:Holliday junction branch migration protein RuvA [uncultured Allofournierella sp.]|uniref:Holliday junction branch migration protein RuvA n=1 Tax=uncultured Allofournierella sp. TaxID=1940258 RepID=UPI0037531FDB